MKAMYSAIWTTSVTAADQVLKDQGYDVLPLYKNAVSNLLYNNIEIKRMNSFQIKPQG